MASTSRILRRLYTVPTVAHFRRADSGKLRNRVREMDNATSLHQALEPAELQLRDDCTTIRNGYRYTAHGFKQVATLLGPGVGRLLPDLAGIRSRDIPDEYLDGRMAIRIFNELIDLRFQEFSSFRIMRNAQSREIDGLIGNAHQYLDNVSFLGATEDALTTYCPQTGFYAAALVGRRLFMWWRANEPFITPQFGSRSWPCHLGYYFGNGESAGVSARATLAIFTPAGICLGPYKLYGTRVSHRGRDFTQRLGAELHKVLQLQLPVAEWQEKLTPSLATSLGFAESLDPRARKQRQNLLATILRRLGVDYTLGQEILRTALALGRHVTRPDDVPYQRPEPLHATRTAFDLLVCLLHSARQLDMRRREILEQAAFHLFVGKFF